jgi:DNA-binding CsgD family transcriptional regulator
MPTKVSPGQAWPAGFRGSGAAPRGGQSALSSRSMRRVLLYGLAGGVLLVLLKILEYQYLVRAYPGEVYGGLVAVIFSGLGIYFGLHWARSREQAVVVKEVRAPEGKSGPAPEGGGGPFVLDAAKLKELGITPREHEILGLIAEGLSNREIGERLFVSENTVKTHSSRLFEKLGVNRRVQAARQGRTLGLIP